ncbi:MAG: hypothetical protein JSS23_10175 [Proteobacteria bacterium]|nr:hypothetical protein [Pseudomonadota bacterium]
MTESPADAALMFGATGRLGKVMMEALHERGIKPIAIGRPLLADFASNGALPTLPERLWLMDASIDYSDMWGHEAEKHAFIAEVARHSHIGLIASFSSGAVDFDDTQILNPFYLEYKRLKQHNLAYFKSLGSRLFYPKIYTLIGPHSYCTKTTGWVHVLDHSIKFGAVSIAHPRELRSWISEACVRRSFLQFIDSGRREFLDAAVCGTFHLADVVAFCEARLGHPVTVKPRSAPSWLGAPYVAPAPTRPDACSCDLHSQLAHLIDLHSDP